MSFRLPRLEPLTEVRVDMVHLAFAATDAAVDIIDADGDHADLVAIVEQYRRVRDGDV